MKIAIDAMGGDLAPAAVVGGAKNALRDSSSVSKLFLVGDESKIRSELDSQSVATDKIEIVHASEVIEMGDSAAKSIRRKKDASISVAVNLVKSGDADAIFSAGHTGATVVAASLKLRTLPGVDRPGIASPLPNEFGLCNIVDAGANVDAKAMHLVHYGIMGSVYARHVLGKKNPVVGLMSVGEEEGKGTDFTREVFNLLREAPINFKGNVEGHDLFETELDVVVCDGFTGNVVLKSCEATANAMFKWLKQEIYKSPVRKFGATLAKPAFRAVHDRANYESYGGSPLLGVNGVCIIGHGSSSPLAIQNAIHLAIESVAHGVNPHIEEEIAKFRATVAAPAPARVEMPS
ncbi:MAG: phosphate acyltransferase PlsX [Verrucomicrobiales bacterium]|nr:phosphate acyltransferase PlsX [Verrucomicrobiales bacterium]